MPDAAHVPTRVYDEGAEVLLASENFPDRVTLLPPDKVRLSVRGRARQTAPVTPFPHRQPSLRI